MTRLLIKSRASAVLLVFALAACGSLRSAWAAESTSSTVSAAGGAGLRVHVHVLIDAKYGLKDYLQRALARDLPRRLGAALGPECDVSLELVEAFPLAVHAAEVGIQPPSQAAVEALKYDKVLHLLVRETYSSCEIAAQDYDVPTRYLCPAVHSEVRQPAHVIDRAVQTLLAAFSPAAEFQQLPDDPDHVVVTERLRVLAAEGETGLALSPGDLLIPILRRSVPDAETGLVETQVVPWTVLIALERSEDDDGVLCRVVSSNRRPLGVRRRGRIEQLAVRVRPAPAPVTLQLTTQVEPRRPLSGCGVYLRDTEEGQPAESMRLGVSDQSGRIEVPPGEEPVQLVWIKSGSLLLARLPIVAGLHREIEVPLSEDRERIRAEADLEALRTELIDLVARRNILLARGRAAVDAGDLALANQLAAELDRLPTRAQFNQRINTVAQTAKSPDRLAQSRIDKLVEETRSVLAQHLDPRTIGELRTKIIGATSR